MQYLQIILSLNVDTKLSEILLKEHAEMFNINSDKYQMGIQRFIKEETCRRPIGPIYILGPWTLEYKKKK
jgi:hypothetical protein